ncbi:MAG: helix-turn-helix transcriptional regulator [Hyphomicrobiaceae bacterium]|nr:MAG: helix-turn-helix transcriptional regulator [Hyphomicrobiaceae bacterium]
MIEHSHKTLTTESEIAAYLHRTRMAILEVLRKGPATGSEIAATIGVHPANLTRHLRILVDADLIRLIEKRDTGRNLEKWYAATATSFDVAPEADGLSAPHKIALAFARSEISAALARLPDTSPGTVKTLVVEARLSQSDIDHYAKALEELAGRFAAANGSGDTSIHLVLSLHPGDAKERRPLIIKLQRRQKSATATKRRGGRKRD